MRRRGVLIVLGVVVFLAISLEVARFGTADNAERAAIFAVLQAEARGDAPAVLERLDDCRGACAADVRRTVARARRPGPVKILRLDPGTRFALGERTGRTRVAWAADVAAGGAAVVQCVTVRRKRGLLAGTSVTLLRLSAPLPPEKGC